MVFQRVVRTAVLFCSVIGSSGAPALAAALTADAGSPFCTSVADCSLAGFCYTGSSCACDPGFTGPRCETLHLRNNATHTHEQWEQPMSDVHTVWGGHAVYSPADQRQTGLSRTDLAANASWHWFGAAIANNCSLASWSTNSLAAHAVAVQTTEGQDPSLRGPFKFPSNGPATKGRMVLPPAAPGSWDAGSIHGVYVVANPRPWANGSDAFVMFYTGFPLTPNATAGPALEPVDCSVAAQPTVNAEMMASRRIGVATAPGPSGPWTRFWGNPVFGPAAEGFGSSSVSNAAPAFSLAGDGSLIMLYKGLAKAEPHDPHKPCTDGSGVPCIGAARAPHWSGPWERINTTANGTVWMGEDPTLFETGRGWHAVFEHYVHDERGGVLGHAWSADNGASWTLSPEDSWVTTTTHLEGKELTLTKRERPQIVAAASSFFGAVPVALFNGACLANDCFNIVDLFTQDQKRIANPQGNA